MRKIARIFWEFRLLVVILFAPLLLAIFLAWFVPLIGTEPPDTEVKQVIAFPSVSQRIEESGAQKQEQKKASVFVDHGAEAMAAAIQKSKDLGYYREAITETLTLYLLFHLPDQVYVFYFPKTGKIVFDLEASAELHVIGKAQSAMMELLEGYEDVACGFEALLHRDTKAVISGGKQIKVPICPGQD